MRQKTQLVRDYERLPKKRLAQLYERCGGIRQLAALLAISPATARVLLKNAGVPLQPPGRRPK